MISVPPLNEGTSYVVLVTDRVKDLNGDKLVRSTLGKILLLDPSISVFANGKSEVFGMSDAQAAGIDQMRQAVNLAAASLVAEKSASGLARDDIVMAYTFRTQGMGRIATTLPRCRTRTPPPPLRQRQEDLLPNLGAPACDGTIAEALSAHGLAGVPSGNIFAIVDPNIATFDKLICPIGASGCADTGAFTPQAVPPAPESIRMLVAPAAPASTGCTPGTRRARLHAPAGRLAPRVRELAQDRCWRSPMP